MTNSELVDLIDAIIPSIPNDAEDRRVLTYIRSQCSPDALAERAAQWGGDPGVAHLHDVARSRLRPYLNKETSSDRPE